VEALPHAIALAVPHLDQAAARLGSYQRAQELDELRHLRSVAIQWLMSS